MFIDKFYRLHSPYYSKTQLTTQSRSSKPSLNLNNNWGALNYKIENVKAGVEPNDASNMAQTLTRKDIYFVQGKYNYMFIEESEDGKWDGRNRILQNIKDGVEPNDVVCVGQTLVCDN